MKNTMIFHDKYMKFNLNWEIQRLIFNKKISPEADFLKLKWLRGQLHILYLKAAFRHLPYCLA
jgi:hypothetical protein